MNIVDSSGWLEFFADGANASFFAPVLGDATELLVPTISIYEVYKRVRQQRNRSDALAAIAVMQQGQVIDIDADIAVRAAELSVAEKLPMADSIMLACAKLHDAVLWTQDSDFRDISGVRFVDK